MKRRSRLLNNRGFSLVELIVVIAIMAALVGVLAPVLIKNVEKSKISTDEQNMDTVREAVIFTIAEDRYHDAFLNCDVDLAGDTGEMTLSITGAADTTLASEALDEVKDELGYDTLPMKSKKYKDKTITYKVINSTVVEIDISE